MQTILFDYTTSINLYRKSLHLEGEEKESILASLRSKLGLSGPVDKMNPSVQIHPGIKTEDQGMVTILYFKNIIFFILILNLHILYDE